MTAPPGSDLVLWSDERIVALDKPAGLSLATRPSAPGEALARLLAVVPEDERELHRLDPDALFLVHRLDVGTSGVLLLARDRETHSALAGLLARRKLRKTYLALVWGRPRPAAGRYDEPLGPDRRDRRRMKVDPAGRPAVTLYDVRAAARWATLLHVTPETGRTHQIRAHLAHAGHPVVGDDLYAGPRHHAVREAVARDALSPAHTFLHAWRVELPASTCTPDLIVTAPLPRDFRRTLEVLGIGDAVA